MPSSNNKSETMIDWRIPPCEPGKCRLNCKKNPNCFAQLGEKFWFGSIKDSFWVQDKDPEDERKEEHGHVGLKNLGATCYVNTFLQLWFTNKPLRAAVYKWHNDEPPDEIISEDSEEYPKSITLSFGADSNRAICGNLQYLFSLLQFSDRRYVDPSAFLESLGIETHEQQDAQEFNKLFISLLDSSLLAQGINIIDKQFGGTYCYQTQCNNCNAISERPSKFYELDLNIKGRSTLNKCLKDFLQEEILEGDNQYFCCNCQCKRDAIRKIVLKKLPRVLNLQLLRFVFDRQTFSKKKLNNSVHFPDVLDMNDYVELENKEDGIYRLNAVLIHRGLSANSGHYIAHIWDKEADMWCRFNDEDVYEMKSKTLELGKEDDLEGTESKKEKRERKAGSEKEGCHHSKNSYMLVYVNGSDDSEQQANPPFKMMEIVAKDNSLFEDWINSIKSKRDKLISKGLERQQEVQNIYLQLPVKENQVEDHDWISTKWIRSWLSVDKTTIPPIDNTEFMCPHSGMDPSKIHLVKRVSCEAADTLYEKYGGLPRFKRDAVCTQCVEFLEKKKLFFASLTNDLKVFSKCLKANYKPMGETYWVGKKTMKQIKQLAIKEFMNSNDITSSQSSSSLSSALMITSPSSSQTSGASDQTNLSSNAGDKNNNEDDDNSTINSNSATPTTTTANTAGSTFPSGKSSTTTPTTKHLTSFNQDIVCPEHGNLNLQVSGRMLIDQEDWLKCLEYFPTAKPLLWSATACRECRELHVSIEKVKEAAKQQAQDQKQNLSFLFETQVERLRRLDLMETGTWHVIPADFIQTWRKKIKQNKTSDEQIDNSDMICEHDLSLYSAEEIVDEIRKTDPDISFLLDDEKRELERAYQFQNPISVSMVTVSTDDDGDDPITKEDEKEIFYECQPTFCKACRRMRLDEEAFDQQSFDNVAIFVQKLTESDQHNYTVDESSKQRTSEDEEAETNGHCDVEISVTSMKASMKKMKRENEQEPKEISNKKFKFDNFVDNGTRRSSRHRRKRGEYAVYVSSTHTLKQLKVQLLSLFSVFPLEQVLTMANGYALTEDDKELGDLGVRPGMQLFLSVAHLDKDNIDQVEPGKERALEAGFKGTNLLCGGKQ